MTVHLVVSAAIPYLREKERRGLLQWPKAEEPLGSALNQHKIYTLSFLRFYNNFHLKKVE